MRFCVYTLYFLNVLLLVSSNETRTIFPSIIINIAILITKNVLYCKCPCEKELRYASTLSFSMKNKKKETNVIGYFQQNNFKRLKNK